MLKYISNKFENLEFPLLGPNIYVLKLWGLILPENTVKRWTYILLHISVIIFTATEYVEIWFVKYDINLLLTNVKITVLATVSVTKVTTFLIWQQRWKSIIEYVNNSDKIQRDNADESKKVIIDRYTKYARKITYCYWILMYMTVVIVICQPIYIYFASEVYRENVRNGTEVYAPVVSSWVPFNKNTGAGYVIASMYQSFAAIYGGGWITSFDTNAIVTMVFFKGELEMLRKDCSEMFGSIDFVLSYDDAKERLKIIQRRHIELIKYSRLFNTCLSPIMLLYVIVCSIMICATAYQINIETSTIQKFLTTEFLIFTISQLFMYCWHSNEVFYVSMDLTLGPYESIWWTRDVSEIKDINILIDQFNRPIVFSAGPFTIINVTTFISILKGAYSYYTLLSQSTGD